jgi:hypothetical protein
MTKHVTYVYMEPFGSRDYMAFKSEAAAYKFQQGLTAQRRASHIVTTTGNSYDEHAAFIREFRAKYVAERVSA